MTTSPAVLFVCLGNICRSPLAEAAFREAAAAIGLVASADSAGLGAWHVGEAPDRRARAVAKRHGASVDDHRGRQVTPADFRRFTHVVAMDHQNLAALRAMRPADATASLSLMLDHLDGRRGEAVADPYYGDDAGFETTWADVTAAAAALAAKLAGQ